MSRPLPRSSLDRLVDLCVSGSVALLSTWWWHQFRLGGLVYGCLVGGALLWRRQRPVATFVAVSLLSIAMVPIEVRDTMLHEGMLLIAVATAMYAAARYGRTMRVAVATGIAAITVGTTVMSLRNLVLMSGEVDPGDTTNALQVAMGYGAGIWAVALVLRIRRVQARHAQERAAAAEREREHLARIAVVEERARIARELHDIVGHSLSVMILHANGGEYAFDRDPERARAALRTIGATGQDALQEIKQLVQMLRSDGSAPAVDDRPPTVVLEQVDAVVDRARGAGLAVELAVDGAPPQVPSSVALAVYRVVQEALTNTLKHAGPAPTATVRLGYRPDAIDVEVTDTGTGLTQGHGGHHGPSGGPSGGVPGGPSRSPSGGTSHAASGHGLVGMRERVSLCGGAFDAGPRLGGGWRVRAHIPLAGAAGQAVAV